MAHTTKLLTEADFKSALKISVRVIPLLDLDSVTLQVSLGITG